MTTIGNMLPSAWTLLNALPAVIYLIGFCVYLLLKFRSGEPIIEESGWLARFGPHVIMAVWFIVVVTSVWCAWPMLLEVCAEVGYEPRARWEAVLGWLSHLVGDPVCCVVGDLYTSMPYSISVILAWVM